MHTAQVLGSCWLLSPWPRWFLSMNSFQLCTTGNDIVNVVLPIFDIINAVFRIRVHYGVLRIRVHYGVLRLQVRIKLHLDPIQNQGNLKVNKKMFDKISNKTFFANVKPYSKMSIRIPDRLVLRGMQI